MHHFFFFLLFDKGHESPINTYNEKAECQTEPKKKYQS